MSPHVTVIIVDFNSGDRLHKCLKHLSAQTFKNFDVIVVNNGHKAYSTPDLNAAYGMNLQLISPDENIGFAAANNEAANHVKGEWLAFLNPDAYPAPNWLEALVAATQRHPTAKAFGSAQMMDSDPERLDGTGDVYHILGIPYRGYYGWGIEHQPEESEVFSVCAAAALYATQTFHALGGFDEHFFCYGEDIDLGYRHRILGGKAVHVPAAIVHHEGSGITGAHSSFTIYHGHRNRIWLAYKNTPFWFYWPFLPMHLLINLYLLIRAPFAGITKPYAKALLDGYLGLMKFRKDRKTIQKDRKANYKSLGQAIEWSPLKISNHKGRHWH